MPTKKCLFDSDTIMTKRESKRFEESMRDLKEDKTISFSKLKKELKHINGTYRISSVNLRN